tara:strand:+ start:334 stop:957 length:624 start_codon:yes stop_codon:yes gene_type:complete
MESKITILPTESVFYGTFDTRLRIIKLPKHYHFGKVYPRYNEVGKQSYRAVRVYRSRIEYDVNFYTSDPAIIADILASDLEVVEITKPLNQAHKEMLHDSDRRVVIRDKLWYRKYKHKITAWHNYEKATTHDESKNMVQWIYDNFDRKSNRLVSNSYGTWFSSPGRLISPPTIFTNSEETMMIFKLAYSSMLRITMETCITLKEIDN